MYFLNDLNPVQREAVECLNGPLLVLAGAGSGKTRVLTYRVAHLVASGVDPWRILAITFTNKAAKEMRERLEVLVGSEGKGLWISTFHSACLRILRREIEKIPGYTRNFVIYDTSDQLALLKEALKELDLDEKKIAPRAVLAAISDAKNSLLSPNAYEGQAVDYFQNQAAKAYRLYQGKLEHSNALDFDDIILLTVRILQNMPDVLEYYQDKFLYILVDEYQDTNHAQYELVRLLAQKHRNLCVVGDDDQSVYSWRGADVQNILDFERDYQEAAVVKLEQNYRSTSKILQAANAVVGKNVKRKEKALWTNNGEGENLVLYVGENEKEEARFVTRKIRELMDKEGRCYNEFAVLYRTNAQSRALEEAFMKEGVPYKIYSGLKFYERMEIKDMLAYLRLIHNPADTISFSRIVNVPKRGLGRGTLEKILVYAQEQNMAISDALEEAEYIPGLQARAANALVSFRTLMRRFREMAERGVQVTVLTEAVIEETGYLQQWSGEKSAEAEARGENLKEFLSVTLEYDMHWQEALEGEASEDLQEQSSLAGFLEQASLVADIDSYEETEDAAKMMTMHSAKGLEFPVVFSVGMEEGIFPGSRSVLSENLMEEERRLCYVAITRSRERLFFTCANSRLIFGRIQKSTPSRFLQELPPDLLTKESTAEEWRRGFGTSGGEAAPDERNWRNRGAALVNSNPAALQVGDRVEHPSFGLGIVMSVKGEGPNAEINVVFRSEVKRLIAGYARLIKI